MPAFPRDLKDWRGVELTIDPGAIDLINPDIYIFRDYIRGSDRINVYIGYYESIEKSDLAHSPLVCYPGQGWKISAKKRISFAIDANSANFIRLIVSKGSVQHLVLYCYKAKELVTASEIKAKFYLLKEKIFHGRSQSAFIRFSTEIKNGDLEKAQNLLVNFIKYNKVFLFEPKKYED